MSDETKQVEAVDNGARAKRLLTEASGVASGGQPKMATRLTAAAQVHASLAIHDQLERLNELLTGSGQEAEETHD